MIGSGIGRAAQIWKFVLWLTFESLSIFSLLGAYACTLVQLLRFAFALAHLPRTFSVKCVRIHVHFTQYFAVISIEKDTVTVIYYALYVIRENYFTHVATSYELCEKVKHTHMESMMATEMHNNENTIQQDNLYFNSIPRAVTPSPCRATKRKQSG